MSPRTLDATSPFDALPSPASRQPRWLEGVDAFLALEEHHDPEAAARGLGLTAPVLLAELESLETAMRLELFTSRRAGACELSPAGRLFLPYAKELKAARDRFLAELRAARPSEATVRIVASTTPGNYLLPVLLHSFRLEHRDAKVEMQVVDSAQVLKCVRAGECEFGITGAESDDERLWSEPFLEDEIVIITPPNHPLAGKDDFHVGQLAEYPWIIRATGSGTQASVEAMLAERVIGRRVYVGLVLESTEAIKLAVRMGEGIALVSRRAVVNEVAIGQLVATALPGAGLMRRFFLVRQKEQLLSDAARALWTHLKAFSREQQLSRPRDAPPAG